MPPSSRGLDFFPYAPRPHQRELVGFLREALMRGGHAVAESGTGTGKTVCALSAALPLARADGRRVLYLTRTNSQARQVVLEYRALRALAPDEPGLAVALQGRQHLCPLRGEDDEMAKSDAEELGIMCRDRMRSAEAQHTSIGLRPQRHQAPPCRFHARGLEDGQDELLAWAREAAPEAEELAARVASAGQCPYVLTRRLLPDAELVVAPYVYFFSPLLRGALLQWMGAGVKDLVVIVDEAHNLPDHARDLVSWSLGMRTLSLAKKEARAFGDVVVHGETTLVQLLSTLERILQEAADEFVPEGVEDALLPPDEWQMLLLSALKTSTSGLDRTVARVDEYGAAVREAQRARGKVPRSHVASVAAFLRSQRWMDESTHVLLVERTSTREPRLTAFAVDPIDATGILQETAGSLHLSGTLAPLVAYRDTLGLPAQSTSIQRFPSPFPPENRLVLVDDEVTTRHEELANDPHMWTRIGERLSDLRAATDRNLAVFVPSYDALHRLAPHLAGALVEERGERQEQVMARVDAFKQGRGATLVSVIGGRISEGLDFPDAQLEVVAIVGLPYARPTARLEALVRFHDRRSGEGWANAVKAPMVRRLLQAAGRLIRTPEDRGVVILLDRRAALMREHLPDLHVTGDPASRLKAFWADTWGKG